jgi:hypothetical protein
MVFRRHVSPGVRSSDKHNTLLGRQQMGRPYDQDPSPVPVQTRLHYLFFPLSTFLSFFKLIETILDFFERVLQFMYLFLQGVHI